MCKLNKWATLMLRGLERLVVLWFAERGSGVRLQVTRTAIAVTQSLVERLCPGLWPLPNHESPLSSDFTESS